MNVDCISQNVSSAIISKDSVLRKILPVKSLKMNNNTLHQIEN